jgi:phosphoenolpyruvate carboxykinase (ATP)
VSRLTPEQAEYHFISGYTAKVAGTEVGVIEPTATFSPCFGGPFLVWHPAKYAEQLSMRIQKHGATVWLINTGWTGGGYGEGTRIKLAYTRAMIDAIHSGELAGAPTKVDPHFRLAVVTRCSNVPDDLLQPKTSWATAAKYDEAAKELARLFAENFKTYVGDVRPDVRNAGPS